MHVGSMQAAHPLRPVVGETGAIAARHRETHSRLEMEPGLKPRSVDDAINLVLDATGNDARFRDFVHSPAVSVDKRHVVTVEGLKVFVMKARTFAQLAVPRP